MSTDSSQKRKIGIAVGVFVLGAAVLAWGLSSYLSEGEAPPPVDPSIQARLDEMQAEADKAAASRPNAPPPAPAAGSPSPFMGMPGGRAP